ncbi:MAG: LacI family DNA-binding transcriptional regulator [Lachnospiraceae bacterium]|nr:LacI family DNA-binding transcriptional regulator [Lachnospiraceae bacterium]
MAARVTIQDIADSLGLSRNTVSKAINNTGVLADATREKILHKAVEMGYKQFSYVSLSPSKTESGAEPILSVRSSTVDTAEVPSPPRRGGTIALFSTMFLGTSHFSSTMLDRMQNELSSLGFGLTMHRVTSENLKNLTLPNSFSREHSDAIICFEVFHQEYSDMICSLDLPVLFVDAPVSRNGDILKADRLIMDNRSNINAFVNEMARRGKSRIGYIGNPFHCTSFYERYISIAEALFMLKLPFHEEYCILGEKNTEEPSGAEEYLEYLVKQLGSMKELPDVFICSNDFIALDVLQAMKQLHISVPKDVLLCGFDDSPESRILTPQLTTIHIHSQIMGFSAVQLLMSRIHNPGMNYRTVYTETTLIYRGSTGD